MKKAALWPPLIWLLVFVAAPVALIAAYSFFTREQGRVVAQFTTEAWKFVLVEATFREFLRSIWIAALATAFSLLMAYPAAMYIAGCGRRTKMLLLALVILPFWTNSLARTISIQLLIKDTWLMNTNAAVVIGLVYNYLPFMVLPLYVSIEKIPLRLLEAASDLGAGPAQRFWRVTVPLTAPGIAAGCMMVFIPCFGAFVIPDMLGNPNSQMVGTDISVLIRGNIPAASALSLLLMAAVMILLILHYRAKKSEGIV